MDPDRFTRLPETGGDRGVVKVARTDSNFGGSSVNKRELHVRLAPFASVPVKTKNLLLLTFPGVPGADEDA